MAIEKNIYRHAAKVYDIIYGIEQPMPDIPFYREYAKEQCGENGENGEILELGCAPFRAFQAVTEQKDIENVFSCVREHLSDDGIFIVNVFNPYANPLDESWCREEIYIGEITDEATGIRVEKHECREKIDPVNQIIYPYLAYVVTYPDGQTERLIEPLQMKYYYSPQLRAEVEKAGLVIADEFSWYDKSPPGGREIILVCRRKI